MLFKKLIISIVMMIIMTAGLNAQEIERNKLTVFGKVRVFTKTDRASISFKIEGVGKTLEHAFSDSNSKMNSISEKLFNIGLNEGNLATSFFKSQENYGNKAFLSSKRDYKTIMTASVTTDSLELLEKIIIILSESDIEAISNISFELVDYSKLRMNAFKKATAKAKEKAEIISEQLGIQLGNAIEVEELRAKDEGNFYRYLGVESFGPNPFNAPFLMQDVHGQSGGVYAEEIQFDSEVKVVFEILNKTTDETNN